MLAARANLLGYFLQKPGDVGQHRIGGPGCLAMIQPRGGREPGIGYYLGRVFGPWEEPVGFAAVKQAGNVELGQQILYAIGSSGRGGRRDQC